MKDDRTSGAWPDTEPRIAVVIPCYRVGDHVVAVLERIGTEVGRIYVVVDACPLDTAAHVEATATDPRVRVLRHATNQGVGGAVTPDIAPHWTTVRTSWSSSTATARWIRH